jgi:hypothetical protein
VESRADQIARETRCLQSFQLKADAIGHLIMNTDLPWIDVAIQIEQLRGLALRLWPDKAWLFDLIYGSRFERLWKQWRDVG